MIPFIELHTYVRAFFLTMLFVTLCSSVCLSFWGFSQKPLLAKALTPLCGMGAFILLLPLSAFLVAERNDIPIVGNPFYDTVIELPAYCVISASVGLFAVMLIIFAFYYRRMRKGISPFSVKESVDKLKTGICFSYKNGMIKLINHKMDELGRIITGKEVNNALEFIASLKNGSFQPGVELVSADENILVRLPDLSVWSFSIKEMNSMYEITAADATDLYRVTEELKISNSGLQNMNERLQQYGKNVDELTKSRERLETKYRIHGELGKALLVTRLYLQNNDGNSDEIINIWKRNITALGVENDTAAEYHTLKSLFSAAEAVGITINMTGEIPEKERVRKLFIEATAEALTNAVRHADAKLFTVKFYSDLFSYSASFSNAIENISEEICEGGGLSSIRKKTEQAGGRMSVTTSPEFTLTITLPK